MAKKTKRVLFGIATNDADYSFKSRLNGKTLWCPFYICWTNMLGRCYSQSRQARMPTYIGVTVCQEWLTFSNFKSWMEKQDWQGKEIDKDILASGNKFYSPNTCVFVDKKTNYFTLDSKASRGRYLLGVSIFKRDGNFRSQCSNPFTKKNEHLGYFDDEFSAHLAWKKRKHELACQLAELQTDERVANALRTRYL